MKTSRFFALMLCLLLVCGAVFGAAALRAEASAYLDEDLIGEAYADAIGSMSARGVLNGFPDGSFQPQSGLTREQSAKIIAYLILGAEAADGLACEAGPFSDVPASRWSASAVAWCAERQIAHGMGDGSFRPDDPLTGQQFAKLLICAFGLGDPERYLGDGWDIRVTQDARALGLLEGDAGMCSDQPVSRQQAALMAFNAQMIKPSAKPVPAADDPAPEIDPAPAADDPVPADDPAPAADDPTPADDPAPAADDPTPVDDPAPTADDPVPADDPAPVTDDPTPTPDDGQSSQEEDNETSLMGGF